MSSGDSNPAATPTACGDIHGDGRWMSLVSLLKIFPHVTYKHAYYVLYVLEQHILHLTLIYLKNLKMMDFCFSVQHNRFVSDSKGKEPDVLFVGDSLVQLMHEFEVWLITLILLSETER